MKEASEKRDKSAKLKKCQQFKRIQKLKSAKKIVMKIALETEKKIVKNRKEMLRKKVLIQLIDFDFGKSR